MRRAWWLLMYLVACGDNDDGRPDIDASASTLCRQIAEVACYDMYSCCAEAEIEQRLGVREPRPISACIDDVEVLCQRRYTEIEFATQAGTVQLDSDAMNTCLHSLLAPADTCTMIQPQEPWEASCKDIDETAFIGNVPRGGDCWIDEECAEKDGYCAANLLCAVKPGPGQSCVTVGCASGAFCRNGTCVARLAAGAPCFATTECQDSLFCDFATPSPTCQPLRDVGHMCTGNFACKSQNCRPGVCVGSGQPCYTPNQCGTRCADDGSFCGTAADCAPGFCSNTGQQCFGDFQCGSGICNFPVQCVPGTCMGPAICAPERTVVDYCEATDFLPLLSSSPPGP